MLAFMDPMLGGALLTGYATLIAVWLRREHATKLEQLRHSYAEGLEQLRHDLGLTAGHDVERHKFRHQMGQFAAKARLDAHIKLGRLVAIAFRTKMGREWTDPKVQRESREAINAAKNYFYDHHYFFSATLDKRFRFIRESLEAEFPNTDVVSANLRDLINCIRADLLLDELARSAARAIRHGKTEETTVTAP